MVDLALLVAHLMALEVVVGGPLRSEIMLLEQMQDQAAQELHQLFLVFR